MSNVGSLVVELSANVAKFQSDMGKAAAEAQKRAQEIDKSFAIVKNGLASLGIGLALTATLEKVRSKIESTIESAAGLQELADKTGSAVEALSGLTAVAKLSNTSSDELAGGLQKLAKSMIDAENGGKKTTAAFEGIGISLNDLKNKSPADVFLLVSNQLAKYQDGAEKVAIAQALLGKSGANLLPVAKDLAAVGEYQAKVTGEQAEQAKNFEDSQKRLAASSDAIYGIIGRQLIPVFDSFEKALLDTQNANNGVRSAVDGLAKDGSIRSWGETAVQVLAGVIDAFDAAWRGVQILGKGIAATAAAGVAAAHLDFAGAKGIFADYAKDVDAIEKRTMFSQRLADQLSKSHAAATEAAPKPKANTSGLGNENQYKGPKDDPAKKYLEGQLKAQEDFIAQEKTLLATREGYIDHYQSLEYYTLRDAEQKKQELIADDLAKTEAAYDAEVAAIKQYLAKTDLLDKDRQDGQNKLAEVARKRAAAETEAGKKINDSQIKIDDVAKRFSLTTEEVARQQAKANDEQQFQTDLLGKDTLAVQQAIAARQIKLDLDERIYQLQKQDPTADTSKAIADAAIQQAKSSALIAEAYDKQRDAVFGASEAMRKYSEDATNAGAQIEGALTDSFKGLEDTLANFVTTGKLNFKDFADSIISDLARIAIRQTITGPLASALGSLFGGSGGSSDILGTFISGLSARAAGGPVSANTPYLVGEMGKELFVPSQAGTIVPNHALNGGAGGQPLTVVQNFTVGDVATLSQVRNAVAGSERRIAGAIGRSQKYGGALSQ